MMPLYLRTAAAGMLLYLGAPSPHAAQSSESSLAAGDWVGELTLPHESDTGDNRQFIRMRFVSDTAGMRAIADLPLSRRWNVRVSVRTAPEGALYLAFPVGADTARFEGTASSDSIAGSVRLGTGTGTLVMLRRAQYDSSRVRALTGNYRIARDRVISMGPMDEADGWLQFFDSGTRRGGILYARNDSAFFAGPALGIDYPIAIQAFADRDGAGSVRRLRWLEIGRPGRVAERLRDIRQERVTFSSGGVQLVGTITLPATRGPHPAVVLIHGCCGIVPTRDFGYWPPYLAHHGIAVLAFDRRGGGESGGDFHTATYEQLADDVLASVDLLRTRNDVDMHRIGLYGMSNGGYVAPLAAARARGRVSFVAVRAGSARRVGGNIDYEVGNDLRVHGFDELAVRRGVALRQEVTQFVIDRPTITSAAWDSLKAKVLSQRSEPWFGLTRTAWVPHVSPTDSAGLAFLNSLREGWKFDPMPYWSQLSMPIYIMLGGHDRSVPSQESATAFRDAFRKSGNTRAVVRLFPTGDHGLLESGSGSEDGAVTPPLYVDDFQAGLVRWIKATTSRARVGARRSR